MLNHAFASIRPSLIRRLTPPLTESQGLRASLIQPYPPPPWPLDHTTTATALLSYIKRQTTSTTPETPVRHAFLDHFHQTAQSLYPLNHLRPPSVEPPS